VCSAPSQTSCTARNKGACNAQRGTKRLRKLKGGLGLLCIRGKHFKFGALEFGTGNQTMQQNLPGGIRSVISEENLNQNMLLSPSPQYRLHSDLFGSEGIPSPYDPGRPLQRYIPLEDCSDLELEDLEADKIKR
jgi:hypothetical protein